MNTVEILQIENVSISPNLTNINSKIKVSVSVTEKIIEIIPITYWGSGEIGSGEQ